MLVSLPSNDDILNALYLSNIFHSNKFIDNKVVGDETFCKPCNAGELVFTVDLLFLLRSWLTLLLFPYRNTQMSSTGSHFNALVWAWRGVG